MSSIMKATSAYRSGKHQENKRKRKKKQVGRKGLFLYKRYLISFYKRYLLPCLQKTQGIKNINKGVKLKLIF